MHDDDSWMPWLGFAYGLGLWFAAIPLAADGGAGLIVAALWAPIAVPPLFWAGVGYLAAVGSRNIGTALLALHEVVAVAAVAAQFGSNESRDTERLWVAANANRIALTTIVVFYLTGQVTAWWSLRRSVQRPVDR